VNDLPVDGFQNAIRAVHGAGSRLISRERVEETFEGDPVWTGEVLTFELLDHPQATRCYCWEVDGRVTAVLGVPPIKTPLDAVRASILAET
jgi:hypothetical protein